MLGKYAVICVKCNIQMGMVRAGVDLIETCSDPPEPYNQYRADVYECPSCGNQVASGLGQPMRNPDFPDDGVVVYEFLHHAADKTPLRKE